MMIAVYLLTKNVVHSHVRVNWSPCTLNVGAVSNVPLSALAALRDSKNDEVWFSVIVGWGILLTWEFPVRGELGFRSWVPTTTGDFLSVGPIEHEGVVICFRNSLSSAQRDPISSLRDAISSYCRSSLHCGQKKGLSELLIVRKAVFERLASNWTVKRGTEKARKASKIPKQNI